jgi:hypothetical protein
MAPQYGSSCDALSALNPVEFVLRNFKTEAEGVDFTDIREGFDI